MAHSTTWGARSSKRQMPSHLASTGTQVRYTAIYPTTALSKNINAAMLRHTCVWLGSPLHRSTSPHRETINPTNSLHDPKLSSSSSCCCFLLLVVVVCCAAGTAVVVIVAAIIMAAPASAAAAASSAGSCTSSQITPDLSAHLPQQ